MRRLLALCSVVLALLTFTACAQPIGTVGYIGGQRLSEADVDKAAAAFAKHGYDRDDTMLFVIEARAARAIMAAKGIASNPTTASAAAEVPQIAALLDDPGTRDIALGVLDFGDVESRLEGHGMAVALADMVQLDPRYGRLQAVTDASGRTSYTLTGLSGAEPGALSTTAPR
ncbi:MAG TPA: hypothetical protein PKM36_03620 [Propionibacteriaceae bacterium]|nr:hypothetical protein [Propionibacteriaceae bacterium]HPZ49562.1 hypothetical protein [Propionibacteriaceae bacterium]HQE32913.1 hypothetical protein [Propionibacteriaceae bacterium]